MNSPEIVIKQTQPIRMAEAIGVAPGFGPENIGPVFDATLPSVWAHLNAASIRPGITVAYFDWPADDGSVTVHLGFEVAARDIPETDAIKVVELPVTTVAAVVHRGPIAGISAVYEDLVRWIEDSGHQLAGLSRELYHEWHEDDPSRNVTELQMPIAEAAASAV